MYLQYYSLCQLTLLNKAFIFYAIPFSGLWATLSLDSSYVYRSFDFGFFLINNEYRIATRESELRCAELMPLRKGTVRKLMKSMCQ